jgi:uncharacterized protein (TIGR01777 family)
MLQHMRIVLGGGTGFLGRALHTRLRAQAHDVTVLTRHPPAQPTQVQWDPNGTAGPWATAFNDADAVVNLAGEGIADARWTEKRKRALRDSRVLSTRSIVAALRTASRPPALLVNASGIGYYGDRGCELVTERTAAGDDVLARLCVDWEQEAQKASPDARVAMVRSGLVLHHSGGALKRMLLPFRAGIGGRLGSGRQYFPWIHLDDWLNLVVAILDAGDATGPFNVTSPEPVTNAEFTRALGRALHRPAMLPVPSFALRLALGELADSLLTGQRAIPARAQQIGFQFRFRTIDEALQNLLT